MGKTKTYKVQFVDQRSSVAAPLSREMKSIPLSSVNTSDSVEDRMEAQSVIKRGAILPFSFDDNQYSDVEVLTTPLVVELHTERAIPACINKSQFIAINPGDRVTIPAGSKVRFDSLRNQVVIIDGIKTSHRVPQGFVVIFSDSLFFSQDQSIRFTNCAGFVPVGSSFKVAKIKYTQESGSTHEQLKEDLLSLISTATIVSAH